MSCGCVFSGRSIPIAWRTLTTKYRTCLVRYPGEERLSIWLASRAKSTELRVAPPERGDTLGR